MSPDEEQMFKLLKYDIFVKHNIKQMISESGTIVI